MSRNYAFAPIGLYGDHGKTLQFVPYDSDSWLDGVPGSGIVLVTPTDTVQLLKFYPGPGAEPFGLSIEDIEAALLAAQDIV